MIFAGALSIFVFLMIAGVAVRADSFNRQVHCTTKVNGENANNNAIQTAINKAKSGSTLCIAAGTYPEQLVINKPLTLVAELTGTFGLSLAALASAYCQTGRLTAASIALWGLCALFFSGSVFHVRSLVRARERFNYHHTLVHSRGLSTNPGRPEGSGCED